MGSEAEQPRHATAADVVVRNGAHLRHAAAQELHGAPLVHVVGPSGRNAVGDIEVGIVGCERPDDAKLLEIPQSQARILVQQSRPALHCLFNGELRKVMWVYPPDMAFSLYKSVLTPSYVKPPA
nr:hypothetical protein [Methylogaea oryzae]